MLSWKAIGKGSTTHAIDIIKQKYTLCGLRVGSKWKPAANPKCNKCKSIMKAKARSKVKRKRIIHGQKMGNKIP